MAVATAAYGGYALARPGHLTQALGEPESTRPAYDRLARIFGVRDLASSALVLTGDDALVRAGMGLRVISDLGDGLVLGTSTADAGVRRKIVAVTVGWAALNAAAWLVDHRRRSR